MPKKQVIRLTEGDLHRIIKESVDNILSELDWKTRTSAALERCKRSGHKSDLAQKDIERAVKKAKESQSKDKEKFNQDFSDYFGDKTKYVKGKGWIKESVNKVLKESGRYNGERDHNGFPSNDVEYIESVDYVIDSIINGNQQQALELIRDMDINDRLELIQYAREVGYIDKLMYIMARL